MIVYFSATGNSKYVAQRIATATGDECLALEKSPVMPEHDTQLGIVSPVYFAGLPTIVGNYLKTSKLFIKNNIYVFFVATCGQTPGQSGAIARQLLLQHGIPVNASYYVKMPQNWTPIWSVRNRAKIQRINDRAEGRIDEIIAHIGNRDSGDFIRSKLPMPFCKVMRRLYNKARKTKHLQVTNKCTGCGICAEACPINAIELRSKKAVWTKDKCVMCLSCLHNCPSFAIRYGHFSEKHGQYRHPKVQKKPLC